MEQGAREITREQEEKIKKEQGAERDEKGAVEIGTKERAPKNGREHGERGKMSKGAGSIDPPNRTSLTNSFLHVTHFFMKKTHVLKNV